MVGGTLHLDAPSGGRFKLGPEAFFDQFAIDGDPGDGVIETIRGSYIGLSAGPSVRLTSSDALAEIRFGIAVGVAVASALEMESEANQGFIDQGIGYRLGANVSGTDTPTLGAQDRQRDSFLVQLSQQRFERVRNVQELVYAGRVGGSGHEVFLPQEATPA
jgi:hypothetical protein